MRKYVIITDSCCDMEYSLRKQYDIEYIPMRVLYNGKDIPANLDWETLSFKEFYSLMRNDVRIKTSQVNAIQYVERFEEIIKKGYDILSISCSSSLSSSYKGSLVAKDELISKYPDSKIFCIDSCNSSMGLGIMCITASKLRAQGKSLEETNEYIEKHKQDINQFVTVDNLSFLKRAGRVSTASAVFGGLLQIKPIIISDIKGQNVAIEKVKGRQNSITRIIDLFVEAYQDSPYQEIYIVHADCENEAISIKERLSGKLTNKNILINIAKIGPIIGASTGPGTVGIFGFGKTVDYCGE